MKQPRKLRFSPEQPPEVTTEQVQPESLAAKVIANVKAAEDEAASLWRAISEADAATTKTTHRNIDTHKGNTHEQ